MNAIEAIDLGKRYGLKGHVAPTLFGTITRRLKREKSEYFWALRGVNFKIQKGKTVGVIGPNGSGKSSMLGLTAGTIAPTEGQIKTHGRIASLLELGAGFHPDLTGRENVFLNAAILGIPREDIQRRFDAIVDFAGLYDFIDMPVKHYSSGMYVRLGFAVAVEVDPDIMLIDEVLSVGDIAFQLKCLDRIRQFQRKGKTLLFVSHALQTIEEFCDEVFLIHKGQLVSQGDAPETILTYIKSYMGEGGYLYTQEFGSKEVEITDVQLRDDQGNETSSFLSGTSMTIKITYHAHKQIEKPVFGFSLKTGNGFYVFGTNTQIMKKPIDVIEGQGIMELKISPLTLLHGNFFLSLSIHSWDHTIQYHRREDWYPFAVKNTSQHLGVFQMNCDWKQKGQIF
ncbi:MAG: ATP-binding cassette domain-containing protein [Kiritimatiellae bacterium]|nr:ATP-binding cassette domain-containing protein [Kiritimatiellia bacterium]